MLTNLRLKTDALNALDLPLKVRSGVVGKLSLQVPWRSLGRAPVVAKIDQVYLVAGFAEPDGELTVEERTARWEVAQAELKRRLVDRAEFAWLTSVAAANDTAGTKHNDAPGDPGASATKGTDGWLAGMLDTVLGNLIVQVSRIHLRLEGDLGDGAPTDPSASAGAANTFATGVTLESLELQTVDEVGEATFQVKGLAERLRKSAALTRLAVYFDVGVASLRPDGREWADLSAAELIAIMVTGSTAHAPQAEDVSGLAADAARQASTRQYLLAPVNAAAVYERRGNRELPSADVASQRVHLHVSEVAARISSSHLRALFIAAEKLERDGRRAPHAHLRPSAAVIGGAREWWTFACAAVRLKLCDAAMESGNRALTLDRALEHMHARKKYVAAYSAHVLAFPKPSGKKGNGKDGGDAARWPPSLPLGAAPDVDEVERTHPTHTCVLFRALAHAKAERSGQARRAVDDEDKDETKGRRSRSGWLSGWKIGFGSQKHADSIVSAAGGVRTEEEVEMSEADWDNLNKVFDVDGHMSVATQVATQTSEGNVLQSEVSVRFGSMSLELVDDEDTKESSRSRSTSAVTTFKMAAEPVTVMHAGVTGLLTGSRSYAASRADHRLYVAAFDLDVDNAKILHVSGARVCGSMDHLRGPAAADEAAQQLWGNGEDGDGDDFADAASSESGDDGEPDTSPAAPGEALAICFRNKPVGVAAPDMAIAVTLAPAYMTLLRAPVDRLVAVLSRHKPTQLAEQEELLKQAVAAGASKTAAAAQERLVHALEERPIVDVSVTVHAPRIAVPSASPGSGGGEIATLLLDLGRFDLRSCVPTELGAAPDKVKLFNAFRVSISDISASITKGAWDTRASWRADASDNALPLLPEFGGNATMLQALAPVEGHAAMEVTFVAGALRAAVSPARLEQLYAVMAQVTSSPSSTSLPSSSGDAVNSEHASDLRDVKQFDAANIAGSEFGSELESEVGEVAAAWTLQASFGRLHWTACRVRLVDGVLKLEAPPLGAIGRGSMSGKQLVPPLKIVEGGALRLSESAAAGKRHAIIVCPNTAAIQAAMTVVRAATGATSHLLGLVRTNRVIQFASAEVAERWKDAINAAARDHSDSSTSIETFNAPSRDENSTAKGNVVGAVDDVSPLAAPALTMKVAMQLSELSIVVAAPLDLTIAPRPTTSGSRTSSASKSNSSDNGDDDDLFFDASDESEWWSGSGGAASGSTPEQVLVRLELSHVGGEFARDASQSKVSVRLAALTVHDAYASAVLGRPCHLLTSGSVSQRMDAADTTEADTFQPSGSGVFHVTYKAWDPSSPSYAGVDSDIAAVLGPLSMVVRRPTIAALAALPVAIKSGKGGEQDSPVGRGEGRSSDGGGRVMDSGMSNVDIKPVETGKARVVMSVSARVDSLRLALLLDDAYDDGVTPGAGCLVEAKATGMDASLKLYPSTMRVKASMGSLQVVDPRLPAEHPYRWIIRPATGVDINDDSKSVESLVMASYETFDPGEEADNATAMLSAKLASLRVVFLYRLVLECQSFFSGLSTAIAEPSSSSSTSLSSDELCAAEKEEAAAARAAALSEARLRGSSAPASLMRLDVLLAAPVIVVPRRTNDTSLALEFDMGLLSAKNAFFIDTAASTANDARAIDMDDSTSPMFTDAENDIKMEETSGTACGVVVDRTAVHLSGVNITVIRGGTCTNVKDEDTSKRVPLMRAPAAARATVWRRLGTPLPFDDTPATVVRGDAAPMQLDLSAEDFRLLTGCVSANFAEKPEALPVALNPLVVVVKRVERANRQRDNRPHTALNTLEKEEDNVAPVFPPRRTSLLLSYPEVTPTGPTVVTTRISVRVALMELALYRGSGRDEPLGVLSLRQLTADISFLAPDTSVVQASIAAIALEDLRGQSGNITSNASRRLVAFGGQLPTPNQDSRGGQAESETDNTLPLLIVESLTGPAVGGSSVLVTLQRLHLEVEPTFLLDVGRVFIPTLAGGGGEAPEEVLPKDIRLETGKVFKLTGDEKLSCGRRLLADTVAGGDYELDGGGFALIVEEGDVFNGPVILVGPSARLTLRHVCVEVATAGGARAAWPYLVQLAPGARIIADPRNKVSFASSLFPSSVVIPTGVLQTVGSETGVRDDGRKTPATVVREPSRTEISLRATCLELRLVGEGKDVGGSGEPPASTDMIDLKLGLVVDVALETVGEDMDAEGDGNDAIEAGGTETDVQMQLIRVRVRHPFEGADGSGGGGGDILAPVDITARYSSRSNASGEQTDDTRVTVGASPLSFALSTERLTLFSRLATHLAASVAAAPTQPCRVFYKVWSSDQSCSAASDVPVQGFNEGVSSASVGAAAWGLWRPRPAPGYASLGDVVSIGTNKPPSDAVLVIRDSSAFTASPVAFERVNAPRSESAAAVVGLTLWRPVPPPGFVALGVVGALAEAGEPPKDALRCVRAELTCAAKGTRGRACAGRGDPPLWIIDNRARTCEPPGGGGGESGDPEVHRVVSAWRDLRVPTGLAGERGAILTAPDESGTANGGVGTAESGGIGSSGTALESCPSTMTVVEFERVWWDYNSGASSRLSIWRPVCPQGWTSLGDIAVPSLEPPVSTIVVSVNEESRALGATARPLRFEQVWRDSGWRARGRGKEGTISFWTPVPPAGYVAVGHVGSASHNPPPTSAVSCLREDLAVTLPLAVFTGGPLWTPSGAGFKLGRKPLAVYQPSAAYAEDWLPLGTFFAVGADAAGGPSRKSQLVVPGGARAPAAKAWRSPTISRRVGVAGGAMTERAGTVISARLDVVNATLFTDAAAQRSPLVRVSLRRVNSDARLAEETAVEVTAAVEASHFNPRTAAWEPVVEPWEVQARYGSCYGSGGGLTPGGYSLRIAGATSLRTVLTHAFADDLIAAYGASLKASTDSERRSVSPGDTSIGGGLVNALGRKVWARSEAGRLVETAPGGVLPFVGAEKPLMAENFGGDGKRSGSNDSGSNAVGTTQDPVYLLVEVLNIENAQGIDSSTRDDEEPPALPPPPLQALRFEVDGGCGFNESASSSMTAGSSTGAALVDVTSWRIRNNAHGGGDDATREPLRLRVELAPTSHRAVAAALAGSGLETFTAAATIDLPPFELLPPEAPVSIAASSSWFPQERGELYTLSPPPTEAEHAAAATPPLERRPHVRLRARLVEGLELCPSRLTPSSEGSSATSTAAHLRRLTLDPDSSAGESDGEAPAAAPRQTLSRLGPISPGASNTSSRLRLRRVHQLELVWWSRNTGANLELSAWAPVCPPGTAALGTVVVPCFSAPSEALVAIAPWTVTGHRAANVTPPANTPDQHPTAPAVGFTRVWADDGSRARKNPEGTVAVWRPTAPEGYVAVGCVITPNHTPPEAEDVACVRSDLAQVAHPAPGVLWKVSGAGEKLGGSSCAMYRTGVAGGAGWTAVSSHKREALLMAPAPWEIRWDAAAGARVEDGEEGEEGSIGEGDGGSSNLGTAFAKDPRIALGLSGPWAPVGSRHLGAGDATAVAVGPARATTVVVDRRGGCLRSPAVLTSHLPFGIEVRLVSLPGSVSPSSPAASWGCSSSGEEGGGGESGGDASCRRISPTVDAFESERFFPFVGWKEPKGQLDEFFTARFNDVRGAHSTSYFKDVPLPEGWRWDGQWEVDLRADVDKSGWAYGANWVTTWPPPPGSGERGLAVTRRRRWTRRRVPIATLDDAASTPFAGIDTIESARTSAAKQAEEAAARWSGVVPPLVTDRATHHTLPLPLGCGSPGVGGDPTLGLDVRVADSSGGRWAWHDAGRDGVGSIPVGGATVRTGAGLWPIPAGCLGRRNERVAGVNSQGPWLAACEKENVRAADGNRTTDITFVAFVAELDAEVSGLNAPNTNRVGGEERGAWRLVAHAPVTIQTALPCSCRYELIAVESSAVVADGVVNPGVPARITAADPRLRLSLRLTPLTASGESAGLCLSPVALTGFTGAPRELFVSAGGGGGVDGGGGIIRLAVAVEPACPAAIGAGPPPLTVDVRAPLLLANGCPFGVCASADDLPSGWMAAVAMAGEQVMLPTPPAALSSGRSGMSNAISGPDVNRRVWIAAANDDASPRGRPVAVDVAPGKRAARAAVTTAAGLVEVVVAAQIWAPRGVSAASTRPCLRAAVVPALSVVNLSDAAVSVRSGDGDPRDLAPGEGPTPVLCSAARCNRLGADVAASDGDDEASGVEVAFAVCSNAGMWCPWLSVADVASSTAGAWVALPTHTSPAGGGDAAWQPPTLLHVSVEPAGEGSLLLVLRGGGDTFGSSAAHVHVANHTSTTISLRQLTSEAPEEPAHGEWFAVDPGCSMPWALSDPLRSAKDLRRREQAMVHNAKLEKRKRRVSEDAERDGEEEEEEEEEEDWADIEGAAASKVDASPVLVEFVVGDPADPGNLARAVVPLPPDVCGGAGGDGSSHGDGGDRSDPFDHPAAFIEPSTAGGSSAQRWALRRRWEGGGGGGCVLVLEVCAAPPAAARSSSSSSEKSDARLRTIKKRWRPIISEAHVEVSLPLASLSVVDGADELLLASLDGLLLRRGASLGASAAAETLELCVRAIQVDDMHPRTAFPVLLWHNPALGPLLRACVTTAPLGDGSDADAGGRGGNVDRHDVRHPALCVNLTPGGLHLRLHEPLAWRLADFYERLRVERASGPAGSPPGGASGRHVATNDPAMTLGLLRLSRLNARITFKPAPDHRPPGLGPAVASVLAFLNLDRLPMTVGEFRRARERTRRSRLVKQIAAHVKGEVLSQALAVLASVNHLGNVAGTLDTFGEKIRTLGSSFEPQDGQHGSGYEGAGSSGVPSEGPSGGSGEGSSFGLLGPGQKNVVTGIAAGGGELAKGLLGGVTGIFSKATSGFQRSGLQGLARGAAQGVVGAATDTAAGAIGFAARVVEGIDATVGEFSDGVKGGADAASARRRRLPLAVRGDGVVRPYARADAEGLHLCRAAGIVDALGGVSHRPFASGRFEAAVRVANGRVLLLSHRHCGVVIAAEERVEWSLAWAQVASLRVTSEEGTNGKDHVDHVVVVQARGLSEQPSVQEHAAHVAGGAVRFISGGLVRTKSGNPADTDHTRRIVRLAPGTDRGAAENVGARMREVWAAARASGQFDSGAGLSGGGF